MASLRKTDFLLAAAVLLASTGASARIYCCDDANGQRVCGDVLPAACYDRKYRELGSQGNVRKEVAPPLSREEIERRKAEEARRKAEEERLAKQRRIDQALLDTYASVEDIDSRRDREIADIERSIEAERARSEELEKRRKRLDEEREFYKGKPLPRELASALKAFESEMTTHSRMLEQKARDIQALRERYAADRARYLELMAQPQVSGRR